MSASARLVDELTTLLYEPLKGKCLTHTPCVIVACGACHQKADKPEAVVHENDCPVYRLQRAEAANTAVIRANADEIADLEDVRDDLEAKVNALREALRKIDTAANWVGRRNSVYPYDSNPEVQTDLRTWAKAIVATGAHPGAWVREVVEDSAALAAASEGE